MSYRIVVDGTDILDYADKEKVLLAPTLEMEINTAGSLEFVMPPIHKNYTICYPMISTVEVYEDSDLIWFGRVLSVGQDFYRQKHIYCEGPLAWFNDSVQKCAEYDETTVHSFFASVIATHNRLVPASRQFSVGTITVPNKSIYRKLCYESTADVLKRMCLEAEGGYFFFRRSNGVNYIDWYAEMPYTCNQIIEFGLNMIDFSVNVDGNTIVTSVVPLGATVQPTPEEELENTENPIAEDDPRVGLPLTLEYTYGSDCVDSPTGIGTYGRITKAVTFSDIEDPAELKAAAEQYLEDTQFDRYTLDCSAADLHSINGNYAAFRLGQTIHCRSNPHLLDRNLPISKVSVNLESAAKTITLGLAKRKTLTEIYKETGSTISTGSTTTSGAITTMNGYDTNSGATQSVARVDNTPISNSTALITSGGVYSQLQNKNSWEFQINGVKHEKGVCNFVT